MRHQSGHAAIAVKERMNPKRALMGGSRGDNRFGSADLAVTFLEAL
jgi:hypothetical protein